MKMGKTKRSWIRDVLLVLPDRVAYGDMLLEHGLIKQIEVHSEELCETIARDKMYLIPGMIDLHCDAIEKEVEPRPKTLIPLQLALYELEKKLAAAGVTTMYHALSVGTGLSLRGNELMREMVNTIDRYKKMKTSIRHRLHLRYELTHFEGMPYAEQLIEEGKVDYFSLMNHGPEQGQYKRPGAFEAYVMKNQGVTREEVAGIVEQLKAKQAQLDWSAVHRLVNRVQTMGIKVASHDDDSIEQIDASLELGASVCEFPLNIETAHYARHHQMAVCVGAPNVIRGGSHEHNMSAKEALLSGAANIICSDYAPSLLLSAAFQLAQEGMLLHEAINTVSLNPATALGIDAEFGSIEVGKKADLLLVELKSDYPSIRKTFVNGQIVYSSQPFDL